MILGDKTMQKTIQSAPTIFYPESDGKPMAETDTHRDLMIDFIQTLKHYFKNENDVYVSGNLFMYYEEGNAYKSISPDVFVVFGVEKKRRNTYKTWEENHTPDFVLEVASPSTIKEDLGPKKNLYNTVLAVKEYFIYDPLGQIVPSFLGFRLVNGKYQEIDIENNRMLSETLGLELGEYDEELRLFYPNTMELLQTPFERADTAEKRADTAEERADTAEKRAEQEAKERKNSEVELAKALAEIERLHTASNK